MLRFIAFVPFPEGFNQVFFTLPTVKWCLGVMLTLGFVLCGNAQETISWEQLEVNKLREVVDSANKMVYDAPVFSEKIKSLHKKKVALSGYMSVVKSPDSSFPDLYMLQRYAQFDYAAEYPLDAIVELSFKRKKGKDQLKTGNTYRIVGKLELNESDPLHPFYLLKKAKVK